MVWLRLVGAMILFAAPLAAQTGSAEGVVAATSAHVTAASTRDLPHVLELDTNIVRDQGISTGPQSRTQLLLRDGSTISLGPNSDFVIDTFVYDREARSARLAMTATRGILRFVGGRASKHEPVILQTPTATVKISGGINFTSIESNGDTETSQAYGNDTVAISKSTGEQRTLVRNGFTMVIKRNEPIAARRTDLGQLTAALTVSNLENGSGTGAVPASAQVSDPQLRGVAAINSGQGASAFSASTFGSGRLLASMTDLTDPLVAEAAQSSAVGAALLVGGTQGFPTSLLPASGGSGSYAAALSSPIFLPQDIATSVVPFPTLTYIDTVNGNATTTTFTSSGNVSIGGNLTLGGNVNVTLSSATTQSFVSGSVTNFWAAQTQVATLSNAKVMELGGDNLILFARLTGGSGTITDTEVALGIPFRSGSTTTTLSPLQSSHLLVGVPATLLPSAGTFTYSLLGATSPTYVDGFGSPGQFTGTLNITFGVNPAQLSALTNHSLSSNVSGLIVALDATVVMPNDASYHLLTVGGLSNPGQQIVQIQSNFTSIGTITGQAQAGASFSGYPNVTVSGLSRACPATTSCGSTLIGFLAGPGGSRAGIRYEIFSSNFNLNQEITGVAAFRR